MNSIKTPIKLEKLEVYDEVEIINPPKKFNEIKIRQYTKEGVLKSKIIKKTPTYFVIEGFGKFDSKTGWAKSYSHNPENPFMIKSLKFITKNPMYFNNIE